MYKPINKMHHLLASNAEYGLGENKVNFIVNATCVLINQ